MREFMLGLIAVGAVIGLLVGRQTERGRRSRKDYSAARTTMNKARKVAVTEIGKAVRFVLIGALVAALIFLAVWRLGSTSATD